MFWTVDAKYLGGPTMCRFNRSDTLEQALADLVQLQSLLPGRSLEIIKLEVFPHTAIVLEIHEREKAIKTARSLYLEVCVATHEARIEVLKAILATLKRP